ncbi:MAG: hypothetical protein KIG95_14230 [Comamonas sp.]|nr:hypothetical protein [Comamonas sp.]
MINAFGYLLLGVALVVIAMNWLCVLATIKNRKNGLTKNHSQVLLVPEILIALAAFMPLPFNKWYLLLPLAMHCGTWILPQSLFYLFREIFYGERTK